MRKSVKTAQGNFTVLQALLRIIIVARDDKRGTGNNDSETASHYRKREVTGRFVWVGKGRKNPYFTIITTRSRGPCTPSTRTSSMSEVAEPPESIVLGLSGSRRAIISGTP